MYKYLTPSLWFFLWWILVLDLPYWFVLRKYEEKPSNFPKPGRFLLLFYLQMIWFFGSIILSFLMWAFFATGSPSQLLTVLSMLVALIALPTPFFSALTGMYPKYITLKGYYYYEYYKGHSGQPQLLSDKRRLKTIGWLQVILLAVMIIISSVYVVWQ